MPNMVETFFAFSRYFAALLFGALIAVRLVGLQYTKKNCITFAAFIVSIFILQVVCLSLFGMDQTLKIYPLISHLPIILFLFFYLKQSWLISFTTMFITFLCCQPLRWIGTLLGEIFQSVSMNHLGYILTGFVMYYFFEKYALQSIYHMMHKSVQSCLLLAAMPTFYYIFDYSTIVYTDFMYSGRTIAVQFMPFITASFYLLFVLLYFEESKKQLKTQRHLDMVESQFKQAQKEFASLKQMQQQAASYRHDMRHHFSLLQNMAMKGQLNEIKLYLQTAQSDLNAITPITYCENETVNLILSSFATKAKAHDISLSIDARLPAQYPFSDTELCALLSNAFENAIHACLHIIEHHKRTIRLRIFSKNNKLCIDIQNSYAVEPVFQNGLPVSNKNDHGFGTKSMIHIVEKYGGIYRFSTNNHLFIFQATI